MLEPAEMSVTIATRAIPMHCTYYSCKIVENECPKGESLFDLSQGVSQEKVPNQ